MTTGFAVSPEHVVNDPADARIGEFVGLRDRDLRVRDRATAATDSPLDAVFIAEGDPVVARAVRAGFDLVTLLVDAEGCLLASMNGPAEWAGEDARKLIEAAVGG